MRGTQKAEPPEGFELLPEDLANPSRLNIEVDAEDVVADLPSEGVAKGKAIEVQEDEGEGHEEKDDTTGRDRVFLCVKASTMSNKLKRIIQRPKVATCALAVGIQDTTLVPACCSKLSRFITD